MPRISYFYGIAISMYFNDHDPPHFHADYAEHHAAVAICGGEVIVGRLPNRELKLVYRWADLRRRELEDNWKRARDGEMLRPIPPLA